MTDKNPYELSGPKRTLLEHVLETIRFAHHFDQIGSITSSTVCLLDDGLEVVVVGVLDFVCRNQACHQIHGQFELHFAINDHTRIIDRLLSPPDAIERLELTITPTGEVSPVSVKVAGDSNVLRITALSSVKLDEIVRDEISDIILKAWQMYSDWDYSDEGERLNKLAAKLRQKHLARVFRQYQQELSES